MRVSYSLSASLFQKGNLSVFIGLIVGIVSLPLLLTAVYQPQRLGSFAMVTSEGGGVVNTKVSNPVVMEEGQESERPMPIPTMNPTSARPLGSNRQLGQSNQIP